MHYVVHSPTKNAIAAVSVYKVVATVVAVTKSARRDEKQQCFSSELLYFVSASKYGKTIVHSNLFIFYSRINHKYLQIL